MDVGSFFDATDDNLTDNFELAINIYVRSMRVLSYLHLENPDDVLNEFSISFQHCLHCEMHNPDIYP